MKQRLVSIDYLRGVAMVMVVYSHIITFSLGGIEPSAIGKWIRDVMLPLFFFISGFCAYKPHRVLNVLGFLRQFWGKTRSVLLPTIVMFLLFMLYSGNSASQYVASYDKSGFWFTWVLWQMQTIYLLTKLIATRFDNKWIKAGIILSPLALMSVFSHTVGFASEAAVIFELVKVKQFFFFFLSGLFMHRFLSILNRILERPTVNTMLLTGCVISNCSGISIGGGITLIINILTLYYIFCNAEIWLSRQNNPIGKTLNLIGRNTLEIYFIHFFLLFNIPRLGDWLMALKADTCFGTHSCDSLVELAIVGAVAIAISLASIGVARVIKLFPQIYSICFGPTKAKV